MDTILQLIIHGLLLGSVFALFSIGLSLIFGVMRVVNFAHGEFIMLGMYSAYWLYSFTGISPYLLAVVVGRGFFAFGMLIERLVIQPIVYTSDGLLATVGLSIILQNLALMLWKADPRVIRGLFKDHSYLSLGNIRIEYTLLLTFVISILLTVAVFYFLKTTKLGKMLRATSQDLQAAKLMGININKMYLLAFAFSSALVGIAGAVIAPAFPITPTIGVSFSLISFVVIIIGGMGNLKGALYAGFLVGIVDAFAGYYLDAAFKESSYFAMLILILWFRPEGLFGKRGA